jgi:fluoroquinolone transport system permease protein
MFVDEMDSLFSRGRTVMKKVLALALHDLKNVRRDLILNMVWLVPLLLAVFLKVTLPSANRLVYDFFSVELYDYSLFIMSVVLLMTPVLIGMMSGLMLLEERDDEMLTYYAITPLTKQGFLMYRLFFPMLIGFIVSLIVASIVNLVLIDWKLCLVLWLMMFETPVVALFIASFAKNKVEGLALAKVTTFLITTPLIIYFVDSKWSMLGVILPPYWAVELFTSSTNESFWWQFVIGVLIHILVIDLLLKRFLQMIG